MTTSNQAPKDIVSPDEIIAFLKQQSVSEEKATGIKLLRRAAETIAYQSDTIAQIEERVSALDEQEDTLIENKNELTAIWAGIQELALTLNQSVDLSPVTTLELLDGAVNSLMTQNEQLRAAMVERDTLIQQYESQPQEVVKPDHNENWTENLLGLIDADEALFKELPVLQEVNGALQEVNGGLQEAVKFGYALVGYSTHNELPMWVLDGAKDIIQYVESQ